MAKQQRKNKATRRPKAKTQGQEVKGSRKLTPRRLATRIRKAPAFVPSFRSEVPLGLTEDMLALTQVGRAAIPVLQKMLAEENPPPVRKAATVMLAHINFSEAEELLRGALADLETRAEALVCLGNFFMRNPAGEYAFENRFLRNPDLVLLDILDYIEDEALVTLDSGFPVYQGPVADLAMGAAVRIIGLDAFADLLDPEAYIYIGLIPRAFDLVVKEALQDRLREQRERLRNLMRGKTDHGTITASEPVTVYTDSFKLSFAPDAAKCNCTKIGWIQIAKATLADGSIGYAAGEKARDTDGDGTLIDRLNGRNNPVYGAGNDAAGTIPASKGQYGKRNGGTDPAELVDKPSGPNGTTIAFESCVFCLEGVDAGTCYGCYKWKYEKKADGTESYTKLGAASKPSKQFEKSAKEWNALPGKIDTPDPAKW